MSTDDVTRATTNDDRGVAQVQASLSEVFWDKLHPTLDGKVYDREVTQIEWR
jgi:hypothetical protein